MFKSRIYYPLYATHLGHTKHAAYPGTTMVVSRQHGHLKRAIFALSYVQVQAKIKPFSHIPDWAERWAKQVLYGK